MVGQLHSMTALPKEYPLNRKLGEAHSWSGHLNEEKNLFLCQELNHNSLVFISVT